MDVMNVIIMNFVQDNVDDSYHSNIDHVSTLQNNFEQTRGVQTFRQ